MRKSAFTSGAVFFALVISLIVFAYRHKSPPTGTLTNSAAQNANVAANVNASQPITTPPAADTPANVNSTAPASDVVLPISGFYVRVTKKTFGQYITKANSPVQPERFSGYHTGADAETTADEKDADVPVYAIANGTLVLKKYASGYGGVILVKFSLNKETITAVYGHVRLSSVTKKVGDTVKKGEQLAVLGTGFSTETDGERKHLHFGLLKGPSTNIKGYVSSTAQLSPWEDPVQWLKSHDAAEPGA